MQHRRTQHVAQALTTMTTRQVADTLGVSANTVRGWVMQGRLEPVRRGARPLLFRTLDVEWLRAERQPAQWHQAMDDLAARWERECLRLGL